MRRLTIKSVLPCLWGWLGCSNVCIGTLLMGIGLVGNACADDVPPADQTQPAKPTEQEVRIEQWIRDLQSDEYVLRRTAFLELWAQGAAALPQVHGALSIKDPQTASAARTLELLLRLEITPKDNDELAELANLTRGSVMGTLQSLAQKGHWRLARELLKINEALWSSQLENLRYDDLNGVVQAAFDQGDSTQAWPAISLMLPPQQRQYLAYRARQYLKSQAALEGADAASIQEQLQRLNYTEPELQALPVDERALYLLYEGQFDEAWKLDTSSTTRFRIATHSRRWPLLKDMQVKSLVMGATNDSIAGLAQQAAFEYLADDLATSDGYLRQVHGEIEKAAETLPIQPTDELLDALALCGDGASLASLLPNSREHVSHFQLTLEYERALEAYGLTRDMDAEQFETWCRRALRGQRGGGREFRDYGAVAQFLVSIGEVEKGKLLFRKLFEMTLNQGGQDRQDALDSLMSSARRSQLRKAALELLDANDGKINNETRQILLIKLFSEFRLSEWQFSADRLYTFMPASLAKDENGSRRWRTLERLWRFDPTLVTDNQSMREVEQWLEAVMQDSLKVGNSADRVCPELARIASQLGLRRLAQTLLKASPRIPLHETAEVLFQNNSLENAVSFWDIAIARSPGQIEWIRKQMTALQMLGERERASQYETSLWLRPLSPDVSQQSDSTHLLLSIDLYRQGLFDQARQHAETATVLAEVNEPYLLLSGEWLGRNCLELEDFTLGAHGWRLAAINMFMARTTLPVSRDIDFEDRESTAAYWHLMQAVADIETGQFERGLDRIARYESLRPGGIEICEHAYPRLIKLGKRAEADQLLQRCGDRMREHLQHWPNDAGSHNNFAWMLARCNVQLSEAREHALLAVQLSEREPTYLDTLAEVEFRLGNVDQAIELAKECIALDPRHMHYRTQLERFRSQPAR